MIPAAVEHWARWLLERRGLAAAAVIVVTAMALAALSRFSIDTDVGSLFPANHESVELFHALDAERESSRTLLLALRGDDLEARLVEDLIRLSESPYLVEVAGTRDELLGDRAEAVRAAPLLALPPGALAELEDRLVGPGRRAAIEESRIRLAQDPFAGREVVLRDPLGLRWVLERAARDAFPVGVDPNSPHVLLDEGRLAVVRVVGASEPFDVDFSGALLDDVEARLDGLDVQALGGYAVARDDAARIRNDLSSSLWWSVPLIVAFLMLSTRSLLQPILYLVPVAFAVVWTLGFGGWLLGPLTPLAVSSAAILIGLGIDYAIHYLERYREERAVAGPRGAVERAHRGTALALLGGMLTSAAAFLSVGFGAFTGLRQFGVLLALGLALALFATWTLLPLILPGLDPGRRGRPGVLPRLAERLSRSSQGKVLAGLVVAAAALGWGLVLSRGLVFDADPAHLRPADRTLDRMAGELAGELGFWPFGVVAVVPAVATLEDLADAVETLRQEGLVARALGPQEALGSTAGRARVGAFRERTRGWIDGAVIDLEAAGLRPDPFRESLDEIAELLERDPPVPGSEALITSGGASFRRVDLFAHERAFDARERDAICATLSAGVGAPVRLADSTQLARELGRVLADDLLRAVGLCMCIVVLFVVAGIGSLRGGAVALLPALAGLGVSMGVLSLLGWPLSPANFIGVPLVLGLGVDDGIHMVRRLREAGRDAMLSTGTAVWRTSVCTAVGFGALVTAATPAIASLGAIVLVGTAACFLASILLVPRLVSRT